MKNPLLFLKARYRRLRHWWLQRLARKLPPGNYTATKDDGETLFFQVVCRKCMAKLMLAGKVTRGKKHKLTERKNCGVCGDRKNVLFSYLFKKDGTVKRATV